MTEQITQIPQERESVLAQIANGLPVIGPIRVATKARQVDSWLKQIDAEQEQAFSAKNVTRARLLAQKGDRLYIQYKRLSRKVADLVLTSALSGLLLASNVVCGYINADQTLPELAPATAHELQIARDETEHNRMLKKYDKDKSGILGPSEKLDMYRDTLKTGKEKRREELKWEI